MPINSNHCKERIVTLQGGFTPKIQIRSKELLLYFKEKTPFHYIITSKAITLLPIQDETPIK